MYDIAASIPGETTDKGIKLSTLLYEKLSLQLEINVQYTLRSSLIIVVYYSLHNILQLHTMVQKGLSKPSIEKFYRFRAFHPQSYDVYL